MFSNCYLNYPDEFCRSMTPQISPFSGPLGPGSSKQMNTMPGTTSSGAPTPGGFTPFNQSQLNMPSPADFTVAPGSPTELDTEYTQGYLKTQIGKRIRVTFLVGTNMLQDREGILRDVGISYIILDETSTNNKVLCDIYSIKFVNIYPS